MANVAGHPVSFRRWKPTDAEAVARLIVLCWQEYDPTQVHAGMLKSYQAWAEKEASKEVETMVVACVGESVIAIAGLSPLIMRRGRQRALLHSVCVDVHARGAGVGRGLMAALLQAAREDGYVEIEMDGVTNPVAVSLYRSLGFHESGRDEHGVNMRQDLTAA